MGRGLIRMQFSLIKRRSVLNCFVVICFAAVIITALSLVSVYAAPGDEEDYYPSEYRLADDRINEWEDRVLIAAMGQLSSKGRVYYAYGDYVDELVSYFVKDDIDLTEAEAKDAISQITDPKNARAGARSGYLYQIGGKPKNSDSLIEDGEYDGKVYPEFDETVRYANESEYRKSDLYLNNKAYIEDRAGSGYESKSAMRRELKQLAASDRYYRKILSERPLNADITEMKAPKNTGIIFMSIAIILLAVTIAIIVRSLRTGAVTSLRRIDDEDWDFKSTGREIHRTRKVSAMVLAVVVAIDLTAVFAGLTFNNTFASDGFIEDAMDTGGICQHGYMSFRDDVHTILTKNRLPQNSLDLAITYRDYRSDYMKGTRSAMKNGSNDVTYRGVEDLAQGQVDIAHKDLSNVTSEVEKLFEDSMSTEIGIFAYKLRQSMKPFFAAGFIVCIVNLLLACFMLVVGRSDIYRGIKDLGGGVLGGTLLWAGACACMKFVYDAADTGLANDDVYVTYVQAMKAIPQFMLILLGIGAVMSALLFVTAAFMRRK